MQPSDQQPKENIGHHNEGVEDVHEQASSPLYEFPAESSLLQAAPMDQRDELLKQPAEESIQQGLIYPPPPAYYQNMQIPPVRPALPLPPDANAPLPFHSSLPGSQAQLYPAGVYVPPFRTYKSAILRRMITLPKRRPAIHKMACYFLLLSNGQPLRQILDLDPIYLSGDLLWMLLEHIPRFRYC
jgi:hypothetical protein